MKKLGKVLILVLSLAVVFSALVIVAGADSGNVALVGDEEFASFDEALAAANKSGETVTLLKSATMKDSIVLEKSLEIDLGSNKLTMDADEGFKLLGDVTLTVTGRGEIVSNGTFVVTDNSDEGSPTVNITGVGGIMKINSVAGNFAKAFTGNLNFKNLDVTAGSVPGNNAIFTCPNVSQTVRSDAVMNFTAVVVNSKNGINADSSIVRLEGRSALRTNYCTFNSNSCVITFGKDDAAKKTYGAYIGTGEVIVADNSYFSSRLMKPSSGETWKIGVIGMYVDVPGDMIFNNSVLESSYRPICLSVRSRGQVILNNSAIKHNGLTWSEALMARTCNIIVNSGSMITSSINLSSLQHSDCETDNTYIVFMNGARMNKRIYDVVFVNRITDGVRFGKEVVGEDGEKTLELFEIPENKDFTVIYDPLGNSEAPFLVVERTYDEEGVETTPKGFDNSGLLYNSSSAGVPKETFYHDNVWLLGETTFPNGSGGDHIPMVRWNYNGIFSGAGYDNNDVFKYVFDEKNSDSSNAMALVFGISNGLEYSDNTVYVTEMDFAFTSEEGAVPGSFIIHARGESGKPEASGNCLAPGIAINSDGVAFYDSNSNGSISNGENSVQLKFDEWNHITVVIYTKKGDANTGQAHYYINGVELGKGAGYNIKNGGKGTAYIYGLRFDANANSAATNSAIYFDNQTFSAYNSYKVGENEDPLVYSPTGGAALNGGDITASATVGGIGFTSINDAIKAANEIGAYAILAKNMENQVVTGKGTLITNGYSLTLGEGSNRASVMSDADGNAVSYTFDPAFNNLFVNYQWFIGNKDIISELKDPSKYIETKVYMGDVPVFPGAEIPNFSRRDGQKIYLTEFVGWSTEVDTATPFEFLPVSASDAINMGGEPIMVYPVCVERVLTEYDVAVLDANGNYVRGFKASNGFIDEAGWNSIGLAYGETFVLMNSDVTIISEFTSARAENGSEKVFNFDVNGYKMNIDFSKHSSKRYPAVFKVLPGETLNFYSSIAGADVRVQGVSSSGEMTGGNLFVLNGAGVDVKDPKLSMGDNTNHNSHLNVGNVTAFEKTYPGSNLTFNVDSLVQLANGDKTCSVNIVGVSIIRSIGWEYALFNNYYSSALLSVKNCNIFLPDSATMLLVSGHKNGMTDVNSDGKKDIKDLTLGLSTEATKPFRAAANVEFDGCNIFAAVNSVGEADGLVKDDYSLKSVLFTNCVTNGRINPSTSGAAVRIGDGCLVYNPSVASIDGVDKYFYNRDMTFGSYSDEVTVTVKYVKDFEKTSDSNYRFNYVEFTYAILGSGVDADVVLPNFVYKYTTADKTYKVTVADSEGNELSSDRYAAGGYVKTTGIANIYNGTVIACVADGTATPELPDGVTEDVTVIPHFKPVSILSSLKTNVTLNSDFVLNLMIPVSYKSFVTGASAGDLKLEVKENGDYLVVSVPVAAKNVTDKVEFSIALEENSYTAVHTETYSVADYVKLILRNEGGAYTDADRRLAWYVLNYAVEADKYFDGKTDNTAVSLLETYADARGEVTERVYENALAETGLSAVFNLATVKLGVAPTYVFTVKAGFAGTVSVTTSKGAYTYNVEASDEDTKLEIVGLSAYELAETATVAAEGTLNGVNVSIEDGKFNIATFASYHKVNSRLDMASSKALNLVNALYDYVVAANAYKA